MAPVRTRYISSPARAATSPEMPTAQEGVDTTTPLLMTWLWLRTWLPSRYCSRVMGTTTTAAMASSVRQCRW
jgi:hypothetical protein